MAVKGQNTTTILGGSIVIAEAFLVYVPFDAL
jgi:hypothetical protein